MPATLIIAALAGLPRIVGRTTSLGGPADVCPLALVELAAAPIGDPVEALDGKHDLREVREQ